MAEGSKVEIIGRSSSHYTRVARIFAHTLGVPYELAVVSDLTSTAPSAYGDNPSLTIPTLRIGGALLFGTESICRRLVELAGSDVRVVWPEEVKSDVARSAQELTWSSMSAQVQLILGKSAGRGAADLLVAKRESGLRNALAWLDGHLDQALDSLPTPRDLSLLETTLFCLIEHLRFRRTIPVEPYPRLRRFAEAFSIRDAAQFTAYAFDGPKPPPRPALERPALDPAAVPPRTTSAYPEELQPRVLPREKRALGDPLGLTRFGVNLTTLFPGKESSMRHFHSREDEMVYVLEGEVVLRTDEGEQILTAGTCAGFPAGSRNGHQLVNRSSRLARYLEIGNRDAADTIGYSDVDLACARDASGAWVFSRKP